MRTISPTAALDVANHAAKSRARGDVPRWFKSVDTTPIRISMKFAHFNGPGAKARPLRDCLPRANAACRSRLAGLPSVRRAALCTAFA